jgi:hypothetical protein
MTFEMRDVGPALSETRLVALERAINVSLPVSYRSFLMRFNGGRPNPEFFPIRGLENKSFGAIQYFFWVDDAIQSVNIDWNYKIYKGRIPSNLFPIACDNWGNLICLSLRGHDRDSVYFWDHDAEHRPPTYDNVYLVASSFPAFLESIYFEDLRDLAGGKLIKGLH